MVPGDSFPATGNHLVAISMNDIDEETSEDEQELLKRLVHIFAMNEIDFA